MLLLLVGVLLGLVFVTGALFGRLVELVGLGHVGTAVWGVLHWPVAFLVVVLIAVAVVAFAAPSARASVSPVGPRLAVHRAGLPHDLCNATYGAFAAVVILMLWAWMASLAFLFGAELHAQLDAGGPGL